MPHSEYTTEGTGISTYYEDESPDGAEKLDEVPGDFDQPSNDNPTPKEIPSDLYDESELANFIDQELWRAESEKAELMENIERWQKVYSPIRATSPKNFPIRNASNLTVPVVLEVVNTIAAQLVQTLQAGEPTWFFQDLGAEWTPFKEKIERFMHIAAERDLKLEEAEIESILEFVKWGTSITEVVHEVEELKLYNYTPDGEAVYSREVISQGPRQYPIPLQDFFIREFETDCNKAKWCGKRVWLSADDLKMYKEQGWRNVDAVLNGQEDTKHDPIEVAQAEADGVKPLEPNHLFEIYELWIRWCMKGDRLPTQIKVYYHKGCRKFLNVRFNTNIMGERPFTRDVYFPVQHRFWGQGVIQQIEELQKEISTIHNQRRDNQTLANLRMILKKKMVQGLKPGDPLYSGKIIEVNDPFQDVREFKMSEIYPSTVAEEQIVRQYVERVSGVSEPRNAPVTRTTATAQLALLQEMAKKFDLTVRLARKARAARGRKTLYLYFQYGTNGKALAWLGEHGRIIDSLFRLPQRAAEMGLAIRASSPTSQVNKESRKQNSLTLFNLMVQLYERLIPMVQQVAPDALPGVSHALVKSAHKFMANALAAFDEADPEELLGGLTLLEKVLPNPADLGGLESYDRAEASTAELAQLGRLESLLRETARSEAPERGVRTVGFDGGGVEIPQRIPGSPVPDFGSSGQPYQSS